jgi:23S rRNA (adenine-N6)-dimethyltransferase
MFGIRRKLFSQNFLHSRALVSRLVGKSSIGKNDLVLEIGPGKGMLTEQLVRRAEHVIGVELDTHWHQVLQQRFKDARNLTLYNADFLVFALPKLPYKVFANIPFAIEGKIIRKLIEDANPPQDCSLVVMKELAVRLCASKRENMFSVMHKPWFTFSIEHAFHPFDFKPAPNVDAVLFRFCRRVDPLLGWEERKKYQLFVQRGFEDGRPLSVSLKRYYPHISDVLQKMSIGKKVRPGELRLEEWVRIYQILRRGWDLNPRYLAIRRFSKPLH